MDKGASSAAVANSKLCWSRPWKTNFQFEIDGPSLDLPAAGGENLALNSRSSPLALQFLVTVHQRHFMSSIYQVPVQRSDSSCTAHPRSDPLKRTTKRGTTFQRKIISVKATRSSPCAANTIISYFCFFSLPFLQFSLPRIIFSLSKLNFSPPLPPIFLYLPCSTALRASSLLCRYIHPFWQYKRSLQPAHTSPPAYPTGPPPTLPATPPPPGPNRPATSDLALSWKADLALSWNVKTPKNW